MNLAPGRLRRLPLILVAAALAFASQLAVAHGGRAHGQQAAPVTPAVEHPAVAPDAAARGLAAPALSQPCPGGSGGGCCCARPTARATGGNAIIVNRAGWARTVPVAARWSKRLPPESSLQSQVVHSPALPRAPPFFS